MVVWRDREAFETVTGESRDDECFDSSRLTPADFSYWSSLEHWEDFEIVALCVGWEPPPFADAFDIFVDTFRRSEDPWERNFAQKLLRMVRLVDRVEFDDSQQRAWVYDETSRKKATPRQVLDWLRRKRLPIPDGMAAAIEGLHSTEPDWRSRALKAEEAFNDASRRIRSLEDAASAQTENASSATRRHETLLKLFIGMAVEQYGYDPEKNRSRTATDIESDTNSAGVPVSDDTIRRYLAEGAELLPPKTG